NFVLFAAQSILFNSALPPSQMSQLHDRMPDSISVGSGLGLQSIQASGSSSQSKYIVTRSPFNSTELRCLVSYTFLTAFHLIVNIFSQVFIEFMIIHQVIHFDVS